jgi:hypothetical protein
MDYRRGEREGRGKREEEKEWTRYMRKGTGRVREKIGFEKGKMVKSEEG